MIDLHTHTLFSDGALIPFELVRRLESRKFDAVAITDHGDSSNIDFIIPRIVRAADDLNNSQTVKVIPGIELTHVPPGMINSLVKKAREYGAKLVIMHGETITEPVAPGTNKAAIMAGVDVLAHPGLIEEEDVKLAVRKGVSLEISARTGHSLTNGHVARISMKFGANLVIGSDSHAPGDLLTREFAEKVVKGAGLPDDSLLELLSNSKKLLQKIGCPV